MMSNPFHFCTVVHNVFRSFTHFMVFHNLHYLTQWLNFSKLVEMQNSTAKQTLAISKLNKILFLDVYNFKIGQNRIKIWKQYKHL